MSSIQTFLPSPDFEQSAKWLDPKRLNKQRVECKQILNALEDPSKGWGNHPMINMWRGHEFLLCTYSIAMCNEWLLRGGNDFKNLLGEFNERIEPYTLVVPNWLGDGRLHSSHRAALLWKHLSYYQRFGWTEAPKLDYYWPKV